MDTFIRNSFEAVFYRLLLKDSENLPSSSLYPSSLYSKDKLWWAQNFYCFLKMEDTPTKKLKLNLGPLDTMLPRFRASMKPQDLGR